MYVLTETSASSPLAAFDPRANKWLNLPPTPGHCEQQRWQGFACVALGCCLYLLGGVYQTLNSETHKWNEGKSSWVAGSDAPVFILRRRHTYTAYLLCHIDQLINSCCMLTS